LNIKKDHDIWC